MKLILDSDTLGIHGLPGELCTMPACKMGLIMSEADRAPAYLKLFSVLICSRAFASVVMIVQGFLL